MALALYDTLTREKRVFTPLDPAQVRIYVCGPTVYDFAHIGNARPVIVFDILFRLLRHLYGADHVTYVRNITDVDDKINARAAEEYPGLPLNEAIRRVTEKTDKQFHADVAALGCLPPTAEPRATEHIEDMKAVIERLVAQGCAYVADEHVLFGVAAMADYGKLSKRSLDEMIAGARVEVAPYKRDAMDFVLWKPSKPGEPAWPSPCGIATPGRPGWHIECSAMADRWLWTDARSRLSEGGLAHPHQFDIHGGGIDLVFPHHENEIAQTRCAFHTPAMANFWMHNGFLQVEGRKMAKSEGNFITIRELFDGWKGKRWRRQEIRLLMLSTQYRQPLDWTLQGLEETQRVISHWEQITANVDHDVIEIKPSEPLASALLDDLNTPDAIFHLHELAKAAGTSRSAANELYANLVFLEVFADRRADADRASQRAELGKDLSTEQKIRWIISSLDSSSSVTATISSTVFDSVFVKQLDPWKKYGPAFISKDDFELIIKEMGIEELNRRVEERLQARRSKDFNKSDRIRDELKAMGIDLEDHKDGSTTWKVKR
ncbi:MAG TPA: cysteine--tRNA ligase [Xanthobacteraceae bacterium]|jgi:cysteinyl-tRNA synthetase|nr:cysteine--tRNA ligase [Xanthobacteraceae bacterium]